MQITSDSAKFCSFNEYIRKDRFQGGASAAGGSVFRSYSFDENNKKDKLLYIGYSYGLGLGPEDLSISGSYFEGLTKYIFDVTNLRNTGNNNANEQSTNEIYE